ncbi:unnamed protein product [Discosporangium mesarthrocarpum]
MGNYGSTSIGLRRRYALEEATEEDQLTNTVKLACSTIIGRQHPSSRDLSNSAIQQETTSPSKRGKETLGCTAYDEKSEAKNASSRPKSLPPRIPSEHTLETRDFVPDVRTPNPRGTRGGDGNKRQHTTNSRHVMTSSRMGLLHRAQEQTASKTTRGDMKDRVGCLPSSAWSEVGTGKSPWGADNRSQEHIQVTEEEPEDRGIKARARSFVNKIPGRKQIRDGEREQGTKLIGVLCS